MVDHNNPQSRNEEILIATIDGKEYNKLPQSRIEELLLELKEVIEEGGGGGGTTNYNNLSNKPQVNGITLSGDKSASDLSLVLAEVGKGLSTNDYSDEEKAKVANLLTAIEGILTGSDIDSFGDVETALSAIKDGSEIDSFGDVEVALLDKADVSDLGTAAAKDSTNAVTSGSTDLVESGAVKDAIDAAVAAAYHHAGTKTVAQLTHDLLIAANEGNVYNITDSGTTTSDFIEGIGKTIDEGSNVGICKVGNTYMFDLLSGFLDTTNFVQKLSTAGLLKNDGTVNTTIEDTVAGHTAAIATKQPITDNSLQTTDKTVPGAINELKSGLTNLDTEVNGDATVYPYADVITIEDAVPSNLVNCSVKVEPVQDLHGYDKPWVGGAGKNKLPLVLADIKTTNTSGTWNDNVYTINNGTVTVYTDDGGNVTSIKANGTFASDTYFRVGIIPLDSSKYILNGCPTGGGWSTYLIYINGVGGSDYRDIGNGISFNGDNNSHSAYIRVNPGTVSNIEFLPMIRLATETDATFAPYTNICPISGHTEVDVQRDGRNLFDPINVETFDATGQGDVRYGHRYNTGTYTVVNNMASESIFVRQVKNDLSEYGQYSTINALNHATINVNDGYMLYVYYQSLTEEQRKNVCVNKGNDTTFEPYQGKTYTIALGDTIYGGTVDFDSGVMTVNRVSVDMGTLPWGADGQNMFRANISGAKTYSRNILPPWKCEVYPTKAQDDISGPCISSTNWTSAVCLWNSGYSDAASVVTALSGKLLVYELATPFTVQLTPQQIQLLKGTNTLTASTGQISVTVNGVSGAIGSVQTEVNDIAEDVAELAEQLPDAPTTDGAYVLTVTVADGTPTYSWESAT